MSSVYRHTAAQGCLFETMAHDRRDGGDHVAVFEIADHDRCGTRCQAPVHADQRTDYAVKLVFVCFARRFEQTL